MARRSSSKQSWVPAAAALLLLATACTSNPAATATAPPTATATSATAVAMTADRAVPTGTANDLMSGSAHHDLAVDGESFKFKIDYFSTGDPQTWTPLGAKNVHLLAYLDPAAGTTAPAVMVDNFQARYQFRAANTELDGFVVDQMIDQSAATGFLITSKISYGSVVATAGVTPELLTRWLALGGRPPVDDVTLQRAGVYGFAVALSFRLLVRNAGDTGWHRRTVVDQLIVPIRPVTDSTATANSTATATAPAATGPSR